MVGTRARITSLEPVSSLDCFVFDNTFSQKSLEKTLPDWKAVAQVKCSK